LLQKPAQESATAINEVNRHHKALCSSHRGRCKSRKGLTGRRENPYSTSAPSLGMMYAHRVRWRENVGRINWAEIQRPYSMRSRMVPKAGIR